MRRSEHSAGCRIRKCLALLLLSILFVQLSISPAAADDTPAIGADGSIEVWRWERVDSQDDLPTANGVWTENGKEVRYRHPVLLMYQWNGKQYFVDGNNCTSGSEFQFLPTALPDGVSFGAKTFRTLENISHMTIRHRGLDSDNGDAKMYNFRLERDTDADTTLYLDVEEDYYFRQASGTDYQKISVLTPNTTSTSVDSGRVKLFSNISNEQDAYICIGSKNGNVYPERSLFSLKMKQFVMYIGYKEQVSAIQSDCTIGSGQVANYNGRLYIAPGVTVTIEKGGVLCVSGVLYNNGTIVNNGGDIVVQKNATIEQLNLNGGAGGVICCDGGDLVILSGGCVTTGRAAEYSSYENGGYGNGFVLRNGATCTNFGTLAVGSSAFVLSGATLDNRASGTMLFGYMPKAQYRGSLNALGASESASVDKYETTTAYNSEYGSVDSADLLYVGKDVLLCNEGSVYLGSWAVELTNASNVTAKGSGKIYTLSWAATAAEKNAWIPFPSAWKGMLQ